MLLIAGSRVAGSWFAVALRHGKRSSTRVLDDFERSFALARGHLQPGQRQPAPGRRRAGQGAVPGLRLQRRLRLRRHPARPAVIDYPQNYRFDFRLRGDSPRQRSAVQGHRRQRRQRLVGQPAEVRVPEAMDRRCATRSATSTRPGGPSPDRTLRTSAKLEFTVYNNVGGKGSVCFDELTFSELLPARRQRRWRRCLAGSGDAQAAADGRRQRARRRVLIDGRAAAPALDLGSVREFGGLTLHWTDGEYASRLCRQVVRRRQRLARCAQRDRAATAAATTSRCRNRRRATWRSTCWTDRRRSFALAEAKIEPLAFAAHAQRFRQGSRQGLRRAAGIRAASAASSRTGPSSVSTAARSRG